MVVTTTRLTFTTTSCGVYNTQTFGIFQSGDCDCVWLCVCVYVSYEVQPQRSVLVGCWEVFALVHPVHSHLDQWVQLASFYWPAGGREPSPHRWEFPHRNLYQCRNQNSWCVKKKAKLCGSSDYSRTWPTVVPVSVVQQLFSFPLIFLCTPQLSCEQKSSTSEWLPTGGLRAKSSPLIHSMHARNCTAKCSVVHNVRATENKTTET